MAYDYQPQWTPSRFSRRVSNDILDCEILLAIERLETLVEDGILRCSLITESIRGRGSDMTDLSHQKVGERVRKLGYRKVKTQDGSRAIVWNSTLLDTLLCARGLKPPVAPSLPGPTIFPELSQANAIDIEHPAEAPPLLVQDPESSRILSVRLQDIRYDFGGPIDIRIFINWLGAHNGISNRRRKFPQLGVMDYLIVIRNDYDNRVRMMVETRRISEEVAMIRALISIIERFVYDMDV